jgi:hypothetical protein
MFVKSTNSREDTSKLYIFSSSGNYISSLSVIYSDARKLLSSCSGITELSRWVGACKKIWYVFLSMCFGIILHSITCSDGVVMVLNVFCEVINTFSLGSVWFRNVTLSHFDFRILELILLETAAFGDVVLWQELVELTISSLYQILTTIPVSSSCPRSVSCRMHVYIYQAVSRCNKASEMYGSHWIRNLWRSYG